MLPTINEFISKYGLENFVVVADSGLMNNANIAELEARGYKYKDQLLSHFGVNVKFEQLNMPEFIGGISQDINSSTIVNQAASENYKLGEFAGTLTAFGNGKNKIRKYCDEPGFIVAILSISPIPTYSQLLPKMFLKHHRLDYYFPEFGNVNSTLSF